MAHTISTLKAHHNPHVAGAARNIEILLSWQGDARSPYVVTILLAWVETSMEATTDRDAWAALRGYASRGVCATMAPKHGMIVVNGVPTLARQDGATLAIDMDAIGCSRAVGLGAFRS